MCLTIKLVQSFKNQTQHKEEKNKLNNNKRLVRCFQTLKESLEGGVGDNNFWFINVSVATEESPRETLRERKKITKTVNTQRAKLAQR